MKEIFLYYAKCNQAINREMIRVIEESPAGAYDSPVDGYFKSIGEILDHIYKADRIWIDSIGTVKPYKVFKDAYFDAKPDFGKRVFLTLADLKKNRIVLDDIIVRLANELEEADLGLTLSRVNKKGERQDRILWKALVHVFNHETHHRGQVSQILDQLKIENDYSNMIRIE